MAILYNVMPTYKYVNKINIYSRFISISTDSNTGLLAPMPFIRKHSA